MTEPTNDPNVDPKPNADPKPEGGDPTPKSPAEATHEITVNGEKRQVTLAEALKLAEKSAGADAKFEEASKLRKEAAEGIRQAELVKKLNDPEYEPSEAEIRELAALIGVTPEEFIEQLNAAGGNDVGGNDDKGGQGQGGLDFEEEFQKVFGMSAEEAKVHLELSKQNHLDQTRQQIRTTTDKAVDTDEVFGKMIVGESKEAKEEAIKNMVAEDVLGRIRDGEPYGPELVAASIQRIRAHLKSFGTPGKPDQYPINLGLGPSAGLPAEIHSEKPIERISAAEDGDGQNFVARWTQRALQARRSEGR